MSDERMFPLLAVNRGARKDIAPGPRQVPGAGAPAIVSVIDSPVAAEPEGCRHCTRCDGSGEVDHDCGDSTCGAERDPCFVCDGTGFRPAAPEKEVADG